MRTSIASVAAFTAAGVLAGSVPAYKHDPKTPENCNRWFDNEGGYPCKTTPFLPGITREQYLAWNPSLDKETCTPFNVQQSYCVGVCEKNCTTSTLASTTTSSALRSATLATTVVSTLASAPAVATPTPVQDGMVKGCKAFTLVTKGLSCKDVANQYGLVVSELVGFNPSFKDDCSGISPGYHACVGL